MPPSPLTAADRDILTHGFRSKAKALETLRAARLRGLVLAVTAQVDYENVFIDDLWHQWSAHPGPVAVDASTYGTLCQERAAQTEHILRRLLEEVTVIEREHALTVTQHITDFRVSMGDDDA